MLKMKKYCTNIATMFQQYCHDSSYIPPILSHFLKIEKNKNFDNIPTILLRKKIWILKNNFGQTIFRQYSCNAPAILFNIPAILRTFGAKFSQYCLNIRCYWAIIKTIKNSIEIVWKSVLNKYGNGIENRELFPIPFLYFFITFFNSFSLTFQCFFNTLYFYVVFKQAL